MNLELNNASLLDEDIWHHNDAEGDIVFDDDVDADETAEQAAQAAEAVAMILPFLKRSPEKKAWKQAVKSRCGKKPLIGKRKRAKYFKCLNDLAREKRKRVSGVSQADIAAILAERQRGKKEEKRKGAHPAVWIVGGVLVAGLTTFLIIRLRKR